MAGFIQFMRCEASDELLRHPNAFALLALIAQRARRDVPLINPYGLQIGEALVGDSAAVGLTRQEFRTALSNLQKWALVTTRTTNKGTIAKLSNSAIYDINADAPNQQPNQSATSRQPRSNQRTTTKKNVIIEEEIREEDKPSSLRSEDAATAAAGGPEKKIEPEPISESPAPDQKKPPVAKPPRTGRREPAELTGELAALLNPGGLAHRVQTMKEPFTQAEADGLVAKYGAAAARNIVQEMANYAKLTTNSVSANLTAHKWLSKRESPQPVQSHANVSNGAQQSRYHTQRHAGGFGSFGGGRTPGGVVAQPVGVAAAGGPADAVSRTP